MSKPRGPKPGTVHMTEEQCAKLSRSMLTSDTIKKLQQRLAKDLRRSERPAKSNVMARLRAWHHVRRLGLVPKQASALHDAYADFYLRAYS